MLNIFKPKQTNQTPPQTKAVPLSNAVTFHGNGRPIWSGRDTQSLTRNGFAANPIGFRCVKMIAESVAAIPFTLYTDGARLDTHPVLSLIIAPEFRPRPCRFYGKPDWAIIADGERVC